MDSQIFFSESFNDGAGAINGTDDVGGVGWTTSCPDCLPGGVPGGADDYFKIVSNALQAQDSNGPATFETGNIDISSCTGNIQVSFDLSENGTMEACGTGCVSVDWVAFQYSIDGGAWQDPANSFFCAGGCADLNVIAADDQTGVVNYNSGCLPSGNTIAIRIIVQCWAASEQWIIDNVVVQCDNSNDAGTNGSVSVCATGSPLDLFDELGGTPDNGGTWSGPSGLSNGDQGTFDPASDLAGTYTYTVGAGACAVTADVDVTFTGTITPTFDGISPICSGDALAALPTTSTNGITGSWSPALDNTATTTYTFTPDAGQCATTTTLTITVNPNVTPTFNPVADICSGDALAALPTTSTNGITGSWSPALDNTATTTYTFTPDAGQCATTTTLTITVNPNVTPTFNPVADICSGDALAALPTTSTNGITGSWSPALDNTATTTYTFTPDAGQCATTTTLTITVNPNVTPTFNPVADICSGDVLGALPTTSTNGITGSWSPALDNTATTTYTFTPDAGQCATTTTLTITVNPNVTPTFNPVADICSGDALAALPTTSTNGITGSWSPALDNTATTTYTFTPDAGQCGTTTTMTIIVNNPTTNTVTVNLCSGANHTYADGTVSNNITANESHTSVLIASNGCDSTVTEDIVIGPNITNTLSINVCDGDTYTFADATTQTITANVSVSTTLTAANGCDSIVTEDITMISPVVNVVDLEICENDTYTFADATSQVITGNISVTTVLTAANGCDSTVTENITMLPVYNITENVNACENSVYTFPDGSTQTITASTTYTSNLSTANGGCDSVIITNVTMDPIITNTVTANVCDGATYTFADATTQTITGNVSVTTTLTAASGCDSVVTEDITMISPVTNTVTVNLCSGANHTYADGTVSNNITANESYTSTLVAAIGCDSLVTEDVVIGPAITNTVTADVCDGATYTFADATTQTITGNVSVTTTLTAASGCDSVVTEDITMISPVTNTVTVNLCSGSNHTYADGTVSNNITANESYTSTLVAANGCDSLVTEDVVIGPAITNTVTANVCDGATYTFADATTQTITGNVSVTTTLTAASGCDSVVTEDITMISPVNNTVTVNLCSGSNHTYADGTVSNNITANESYTSTLVAANGCDSLVTEDVVIGPVITNTVTANVCDGATYTFADATTQTITGNVSVTTTLTAASGCDSIVTEEITMISPVSNTVTVNLCSGSNHTYADGTVSNNITANESYTSTLVAANGCDSLVTEDVVIGPAITNTVTANVCDGATYTFADATTQTITGNVSITTTLTAASGCDSIVTEDITMISPVTNTVTVNLCSGSNHTYADGTVSNNITANESYTSTLVAANGCDSLVTEDVVIGPAITNTVTSNVCDGATYTFADATTQMITGNVSVTTTLTAASGCDSIVTEEITMISPVTNTVTVNLCSGANHIYADGTVSNNITANESYTSTLVAANGCDSLVTEDVVIGPAITNTVTANVCDGATYTFADATTQTITGNVSITTTLTAASGCDSIVTEEITMISPVTNTVTVNLCSGANHTYADGTVSNNITANESYTSTLVAANGCDSLVTEDVVIGPAITNTVTANVCDGATYTFADATTQTITGNVSVTTTLSAASGCDSIVTEEINVIVPSTTVIDTSICEGSDYTSVGDAANFVNVLVDFQHTSVLTSANGCDSIIIENISIIPPLTLDIGDQISLCYGDSVTLSATTNASSILWSNGDTNMITTINTTNDIIITAEVTGICGTIIDSVSITVFDPPILDAGPDITIPLGATADLNVLSTSPPLDYFWTPSTYLDCIDCEDPVSSPQENISYIVSGIDANGCIGYDTISITIEGEITIYIPNVFSPNNDGENDFFKVYGAEWETYKMQIFDRWGAIIFESEDPNYNWDGTHYKNGEIIPQAVFVYKFMGISPIGGVYERAGNVMLVR